LSDHLRGNSDNPLLYRHIAEGAARVRFRPVREGWRLVERELYRAFCETFGAPPHANRLTP
jgi:RNA polymerase sigma-54 factor